MAPLENEPGSAPEVVVTLTWRQWPDGRWEAWIDDGSGRLPHRVRSLEELVRCLKRIGEESDPPH
jgi:hypothetical protein